MWEKIFFRYLKKNNIVIKNYFLVKNKLISCQFLLIVAFIVGLLGCKKIEVEKIIEFKLNANVSAKLQAWLKNQAAILSASKNNIDSIVSLATWEDGMINKVSLNKSVVYVPLKHSKVGMAFFYDHNQMSVDSGCIVRIISNNPKSATQPIKAIISYYQAAVLNINKETSFSGTYISYSIDNKFQHDYGLKNGKVIWRGFISKTSINESIKVNSNNVSIKKNNYECEWWGHYTRWSNGSITLDYVYQVCYDCVTTSIGLTNGGLYIRYNCGGGGGGGDLSDMYNPLLQDIINNLQNNCLKGIVDNMLSNSFINDVNQLLKNTFGLSRKLSIEFNETRGLTGYNGETLAGETQFTINAFGSINVHVNLNLDVLTTASREYSTSFIFHEVMHGYLRANGILETNTGSSAHHRIIIDEYRAKIAASMRNMFPQSSSDFNKLAWNGMTKDDYFNNHPELSEIDKQMIRNTLNDHRLAYLGELCNN
ncbi:MAG: hypothetical protein HYI21_04800 [Sediminibacterium sp. Gen4]|uniref:hypothetical protein n=1 Tax=unclassified Sediminibacterium TaxID=2635961 RepID=UPI0015BD8F40|nr:MULTISPECIES: hypothetical protein [unclassified Sediminibacterium]MBW0161328.1 hypothetical protein [Sediminibacterium sp.]MBW0163188.1 hypothetical protein [Sediminibacterium sp.]NWK65327.1 hypothetical protein [Sediminibacterium sp. Gen4]